MPLAIRRFFQKFPGDEACLVHPFDVRLGQGCECPSCHRSAEWHRIKAARAFSCQWCGDHIHPTVGTLLGDSRAAPQLWLYAIYLFATSRRGVPAKELERQLGVTYETARRMGREIRKHMAAVDGDPKLRGDVEAGETFVGGASKDAGRGGATASTTRPSRWGCPSAAAT